MRVKIDGRNRLVMVRRSAGEEKVWQMPFNNNKLLFMATSTSTSDSVGANDDSGKWFPIAVDL